ncbi:FAD-dependent oxidoreductase [Cereibacter changlensis JA139]|uniref:NADH:ubiquinone reductase (non-electrogenic) n=2 Tax=Cereibacter changlensis TaxID=402884 RepID=A0A2T4JS34_9RHOB|nr:NAD(P)/FAD-dependent oxidoreductase [Cereibacter changlensis]PTE20617.1 FAD-dependent oxidoreductase [Cereibacter changlensis JA139]PZX56269.1 NADH dehydrogenase [Cereibacter changlensis]
MTDRNGAGGGPHVVILGAGFGGLEAAKTLGACGVRVTVIDRQNHHLFQPLLYQVATAALSAPHIAEPIRSILSRFPSVSVRMGEVERIDPEARRLHCADGAEISYDWLILATGAKTGYFGHDDWARVAPGLKTIEDARQIRTRVLMSFEHAERCEDPAERERLMTLAVIGGGPSGVELSGALAELSRFTLARDFRRIHPEAARILLVEAGPRLLSAFGEGSSDFARRRLERLGVKVLTGRSVEAITAESLTVGGETLPVGLVVWAAGVTGSPLARQLGEVDKAGRIAVTRRLEVVGQERVLALGDVARCEGEDGKPLPGLAQVAKQQGAHLGESLAQHLQTGAPLTEFHYRSKGNTAIVGRHAAVYETGKRALRGWGAWLLWAVVHVYLLVGFQNRIAVSIQWLWLYLTYQSGARLISMAEIGPAEVKESLGEPVEEGPARA